MVDSVVLVSEFEYRYVDLAIDDGKTWYDAERHRLMRQSDTYNRSSYDPWLALRYRCIQRYAGWGILA